MEFWLQNHCWVHQQPWRDLCSQWSKPRPGYGQEYSLMVAAGPRWSCLEACCSSTKAMLLSMHNRLGTRLEGKG